MKKLYSILVIIVCINTCYTQKLFERDTTTNRKRIAIVSSSIGAVGTGSITGLATVWYVNNWNPAGFSFFKDGKEWLQMDKFGHFLTASHIANGINKSYYWSGLPERKSKVLGSVISFGYLSMIEVFDGFSKDYGFSWTDIGANALGVGWFLGQEQLWEEQRILLKFSSSLTPYAQFRPSHLGTTIPERLLKDYNGQTYWFSFSPHYLFKKIGIPKWFALSIGYSVDQKLHGVDNYYEVIKEDKTYIFSAQRQYLLSFDIDLTQLPLKRKWLKTLAYTLNHVKIPLPTLILSTQNTPSYSLFYF